jgi:MOSC domain-containing protein YiiM
MSGGSGSSRFFTKGGEIMPEIANGSGEKQLAGRLVSIHIGGAGEPLVPVRSARAVPGRGLEGDRYSAGAGTWSTPGLWSEVTLVSAEAGEVLRASVGFEGDAGELRRNLVTEGINLDELIGVRFRIGEVVLEGVRPCDPCGYLERIVGRRGLKDALRGRGGLRARVLQEGILRAGDDVARAGASLDTGARSHVSLPTSAAKFTESLPPHRPRHQSPGSE